MEFEHEDEKIGGGIITLAVLHFITSAFAILGAIILIGVSGDSEFQKQLASLNVDSSSLSTGAIVFQSIILRIVLIVSLILILKKNKIGVYMNTYFIFWITS